MSGATRVAPHSKFANPLDYNHYFGWYGGKTEMYGPWFDKFLGNKMSTPNGNDKNISLSS